MHQLYTGIDIGTYHVKVVIAQLTESRTEPLKVIGTGIANSKGMRHGYIINTRDATRSIMEAVRLAETMANRKVKSARVSIGGVGLDEIRSTGDASLTTSGGIVTPRDVERAIQDSEKRMSAQLTNKKVIHSLPLAYRIDGSPIPGRPVGMKGSRLTIDTLLITTLEQHYNDLIESVEAAGIEVEGEMAAPLAASLVTLTKEQKMKGVVLANIGAETISVAIFENDVPISVKVFPMGSSDITSDIALSLKIPLQEAEQVKRGAISHTDVPRKKVDDAVAQRLKDMFNLIDAHLKSMQRQRLLPGGIVITGGGSGLATAKDIARATLRLPSQVGTTRLSAVDATWAVAFGLCRWGFTTDQRDSPGGLSDVLGRMWHTIVKGIRALLP